MHFLGAQWKTTLGGRGAKYSAPAEVEWRRRLILCGAHRMQPRHLVGARALAAWRQSAAAAATRIWVKVKWSYKRREWRRARHIAAAASVQCGVSGSLRTYVYKRVRCVGRSRRSVLISFARAGTALGCMCWSRCIRPITATRASHPPALGRPPPAAPCFLPRKYF